MFKKFRWPAILALGAAMTFLTPGTAQARDYYEREHRNRHHVSVYIGYGAGGYYDRGYRHHYGYGYYDRWGHWHYYR
jgi:hypothetical protein